MGEVRDLKIDARTRMFAQNICKLTAQMRYFRNLWSIADQLERSGTSIAANIAEGDYAVSTRDFIYFRSVAMKSAHESDFWLKLCIDLTKTDDSFFGNILKNTPYSEDMGKIAQLKNDLKSSWERALTDVSTIQKILTVIIRTLSTKTKVSRLK